jgi:plasmid maintenance system antidote protein VapI
MTPKEYIRSVGLTVEEAAEQLEVARPYLSRIINGYPAGRKLALRFEDWSKGKVRAADLILER